MKDIDDIKKHMEEFHNINGLNHDINGLLVSKHDKAARKNESYVINNPVYLKAVEAARVKFGIKDEVIDDGEAIILIHVFVRDKYPNLAYSYRETKVFIDEEITKILKAANLSEKWRPFTEEFVVNRRPTTAHVMARIDKITVTKLEKDKITLELRSGLRREDYVNAWKAIAPHLGPAKQLKKLYSNPELDAKMFQDKTKGLAYKKIAKKYYPKEYSNNEIDTIEMVKKRVQRYKQRYIRDKTSEVS